MPTLVSCVIAVGFIALATILVVHVAREIKSPTEGKRIHEALVHLENTIHRSGNQQEHGSYDKSDPHLKIF